MAAHPGDAPEPQAPGDVHRRSEELFDGARSIVGERFAEARFDPDRGLRVTVIDLSDDDESAIESLAQRLGVEEWVRVERADPAALRDWDRLRRDLIRLQTSRPRVLQEYPQPDPGYRRPPVEIHLSARAEVEAAALHASYGTFVALRVGALPFPPAPGGVRPDRQRSWRQQTRPR